MSLTSLTKSGFLTGIFNTVAAKSKDIGFSVADTPMIAPPMSTKYPFTGTCFDYLARFIAARHFASSGAKVSDREWVAESAMQCLAAGAWPKYRRHRKKWAALIQEARKGVDAYVCGNEDSLQALADHAQVLSNMDGLLRAGVCDPSFKPETEVTADLIALARAFDPLAQFGSAAEVLLNPVFTMSADIGGADADLVVDDMIVDFKTTKSLANPASHLHQLVGYAALAELGGIVENQGVYKPRIRHLGVYYSRHGRLLRWDIENLFPSNGWELYLERFEQEYRSLAKAVKSGT